MKFEFETWTTGNSEKRHDPNLSPPDDPDIVLAAKLAIAKFETLCHDKLAQIISS